MRKYYEYYKAWRLEQIIRYSQWYADIIIKQLDRATTTQEFESWMIQGINLDMKMIYKYGVYLD